MYLNNHDHENVYIIAPNKTTKLVCTIKEAIWQFLLQGLDLLRLYLQL